MLFGEWLQAERDRRGWTQSELAQRAGLTPAAINQLESGKRRHPNKATSEKLATALGMTVPEMYQAAYGGTNGNQPVMDPEIQAQWEHLPGWQQRLALLLLEANLRVQREVEETQAQVEQVKRARRQSQQPAPK